MHSRKVREVNCQAKVSYPKPQNSCSTLKRIMVHALSLDVSGPLIMFVGSALGWYRDCNLYDFGGNAEDLDLAVFPNGAEAQ